MRELATFFINPITVARIARIRKQAFGEDSLKRIAVQNTGGQFDEIITETLEKQNALFGGIASLETLTALREARTRSVNKIMKDFMARNSRLNSFFESNGTDKEDVYLEFFPQGVQAFTRDVNKDNIVVKMTTMVNAVTANTETAGGVAVLKEYQDFVTRYNKARGDQLTKKGEISKGTTDLNAAEEAWDDQMFSNLLTFAQLNRNKPENIKLYMDQQLLEADEHHGTTETGKVKGTLTDAEGHPLANVVAHIVDGKMDDAHTDDNGNYETHPLPVGKWTIEYSKGDMKTSREVLIKEGDVLVVDVAM